MKKNQVIEITQKEALKAVKSVKGSQIHCFMGFIGADWSKKSVISLIKGSKRIAWADNWFNHNLAVISDGILHNFDITYPGDKEK
jgi:hypothetical protein